MCSEKALEGHRKDVQSVHLADHSIQDIWLSW